MQKMFCKSGMKIILDGEKVRQINLGKLKRQIKHNDMKTIADIKKAEKKRRHLERMEQRQLMKERKAKRMERHRLLLKQIEKKQKVIK